MTSGPLFVLELDVTLEEVVVRYTDRETSSGT